ncbi:FAD-dependent oxidoreductase [Massilibacteroides sp.]|uniref:FAD-dependent oxidoreductase n=1 Tax=Massilibacteroides sp. TaxID=2034766 RepID=UPI00262FC049|nr:FAD-dependent oxidoreductase [Massilibacteroides sp.]MDD4515026.1 FAD-dependent oxidoreductase [Massilibacteroides sp.]
MRIYLFTILILFLDFGFIEAARLLVEAESFKEKGGWVVDQQFMDIMGSPYLMAHGLGEKVDDARTIVKFPETGVYYIYARTYNWTSPWKLGEGPGKFMLSVNGKKLSSVLGTEGNAWLWQLVGKVTIKTSEVTIGLHDLTGFNGRCDALFFTTEKGDIPPSESESLHAFRRQLQGIVNVPETKTYDLVVVGGGIAGMSTAITAARLGSKVALIQDRPVLGGNNSSEVRVGLSGLIFQSPYPQLGKVVDEIGSIGYWTLWEAKQDPQSERSKNILKVIEENPEKKIHNAGPASNYEDDKKTEIIEQEDNIDLFLNTHVFAVKVDGATIQSVTGKDIITNQEKVFTGKLFVDCTGDGTVGYLAKADYLMGREAKDLFNEATAPEQADKLTMGASVQWYSSEEKKSSGFPYFNYGVTFSDQNCERVTMGEWTWETGMNYDQINDFERIRDYGLLVVYSNWSYLKNNLKENEAYRNRKLDWVAYVSGKRESRRLLGDYILKESDLTKQLIHEDGTASTTWTIDLHYPDPDNSVNFPNAEFKSIAKHIKIDPYPIPYRCLYSRNIENLFMAGRNISVTHIALGTVRVMRTTGMMGEVVGMAASLCKRHNVSPRGVYRYHLDELKLLMQKGCEQRYNECGEKVRYL